MSSVFLQFPPPPCQGNMTALEQEGILKDVPENVEFNCLPDYPEIFVSTDEAIHMSTYRDSAQQAFIPKGRASWKQAYDAWQSEGFKGFFEELALRKGEVPEWLNSASSGMLWILQKLQDINSFVFPESLESENEMLLKYLTVSKWDIAPIKCLAWHPHITKLAVALQDNSVHVHSASNSLSPVLKHKLQTRVTDLCWQPLSASVLAVSCSSCVLIWHIEPTSLAVRPSSSTVQVLAQVGHAPITSIVWSPDSRHLISASAKDTTFYIWDVPMETSVPLKRNRTGGISLLKYSPDGSKLLSASSNSFFRVWETTNWTSEVWSKLEGRCSAACWSPDGTVLLFAMEGEAAIYAVRFKPGLEDHKDNLSVMGTSVQLLDLSSLETNSTMGDIVRVGGHVKSIEWDPTGERVAVMFKGNEILVAVFKATRTPVLELLPGGFVKGKTGETAVHIAFQPHYTHGALLSVVWSSGRVGYIPFEFIPSEEIPLKRRTKVGSLMSLGSPIRQCLL